MGAMVYECRFAVFGQ